MFVALKNFFSPRPLWQNLCFIYITALIIRACTFGFYVQHEERYRQADTNDYHYCAVGMKAGTGMHRCDNLEPIFWRTPGYPLFLHWFYKWYDIKTTDFSSSAAAQKMCIWIQIVLCSLIPVLIFFLAQILTQSIIISWIAALIGVFHIGFILASCYILSDALAHIFFIGFLYFFYRSFSLWFEPNNKKSLSFLFTQAAAAAFFLGIYTWMRPNGQFVVVLSLILLLLGKCAWRIKYSKLLLFTLVFFGTIGGWYMRNYQLTGHLFYCPMSGPYLQSFCAPKIMRRVIKRPYEDCMKILMSQLITKMKQEAHRVATIPGLKVCKEILCNDLAWPWIKNYPYYFAYDWAKEVNKTTFDLYSSQLVAMVNKTHTNDPLEEFFSEKVALCLYKQPMPFFMRLICWLELLFSLWLWIGLLVGLIIFLLQPLLAKKVTSQQRSLQGLWFKTWFLMGGMLVMTGGFGYARLRMPIDPLLIILSLTFWYYLYENYKKRTHMPRIS